MGENDVHDVNHRPEQDENSRSPGEIAAKHESTTAMPLFTEDSEPRERERSIVEPTVTPEERNHQLRLLQSDVTRCTLCPEPVSNRTQTVFGAGNPQARLCFLGEAPGADEDRQGTPFVGRSGKLLNDILKACTLSREEVFILNVLKCRPPDNRTPLPDEVMNCRPFFERQLEIIQPEFICCLGSVAATSLLQVKSSLGNLRGKFHTWRGSKVIVTYHPSYLLRTPSAKRATWEDMQLLMREMGITLK